MSTLKQSAFYSTKVGSFYTAEGYGITAAKLTLQIADCGGMCGVKASGDLCMIFPFMRPATEEEIAQWYSERDAHTRAK